MVHIRQCFLEVICRNTAALGRSMIRITNCACSFGLGQDEGHDLSHQRNQVHQPVHQSTKRRTDSRLQLHKLLSWVGLVWNHDWALPRGSGSSNARPAVTDVPWSTTRVDRWISTYHYVLSSTTDFTCNKESGRSPVDTKRARNTRRLSGKWFIMLQRQHCSLTTRRRSSRQKEHCAETHSDLSSCYGQSRLWKFKIRVICRCRGRVLQASNMTPVVLPGKGKVGIFHWWR